ncbi:MAG: acyl-CoA dehydrogenase family protein [Acidimicrobiales bacterium]
MFQWTDEQEMVRGAVRQFIDKEIRPRIDEFEHGDTPPYDVLRKLFRDFGMDVAARDRFAKQIAFEKEVAAAVEKGETPAGEAQARRRRWRLVAHAHPDHRALQGLPGHGHRHGRVDGAHVGRHQLQGHHRPEGAVGARPAHHGQVGAWAITEPNSGSDAFGSMKSTARKDGDEYVLNGSKTFITNGPYADTIVFICKFDEGNDPKDRKILSFVLDRGTPGLEQSKPLRKMGMHSSPTGELFLDDVRVTKDRLIGETEDPPAGGREGAKATFMQERSGVAAMALGIIEECLTISVDYAKNRVQFGSPIGDFQLIQDKLARMEVARLNVENLVFRTIEMSAAGHSMTLAEASAMKLYSARAATEVALEAVQILGGNGYMSEFRVEQLARDAKVLQIYAGTDEIQITHIAKDLLRR